MPRKHTHLAPVPFEPPFRAEGLAVLTEDLLLPMYDPGIGADDGLYWY
jgi:hypothetical protein